MQSTIDFATKVPHPNVQDENERPRGYPRRSDFLFNAQHVLEKTAETE
jgi:hypothetical protein